MPGSTARKKNRLRSDPPKKRSDFEGRKLRAPLDQEQAREWLRNVADHLEAFPYASDSLRFVAHAIKTYLSGEIITLEAALGIRGKRGAPGSPKDRRRMAETIHALKKAGKSRAQIRKALEDLGFLDTDSGTIRRTYKEFLKDLEAEDRMREILDELLQEYLSSILIFPPI